MLATEPKLTLNNGVEIPALGFGFFQTLLKSPKRRPKRLSGSATA
jgi:hypothetical protein